LPSVIMPSHGHYLIGGTSYGLTSYAAPNASLSTDISDGDGVALFNNNVTTDAGARLDAAGFAGVPDPTYREGTGLSPASGITSDGEITFVRKVVVGVPSDNDNNDADFVLLATDGGNYNLRQAGLGAPGPENTSSPINPGSLVSLSLIDPAMTSTESPNRART